MTDNNIRYFTKNNLTYLDNFKEEIWVNEGLIPISDSERNTLFQKQKIKEIKDENGNILERWILWVKVNEFVKFGLNDCIFKMIDKGTYKFGNGLQGKIPPKRTDNITITYFEGGGSQGNVESKEIKVLKSLYHLLIQLLTHYQQKGI